MSARAFEKIEKGLKEALAIARGEAEPARLHVIEAGRPPSSEPPRPKPRPKPEPKP